jgi:hypothetical protein
VRARYRALVVRAALVGSLILAACGRVGFQRAPEAAIDGGSADAGLEPMRDGGADAGCVWTPFGPVSAIAAVDTPEREGGGALSFDGLRLYFNRASEPARHDILVASRASREAAFGPGARIAGLNTDANEAEVSISDDELTVFFHSNRAGTTSVYVADRADRAGAFSNVRCAVEGCPMLVAPTVSTDGLHLYAAALGASGASAIFASERASSVDPFSAPVELAQLSASGVDAGYPGLSHDGLELYYVRNGAPGSAGCDELWVATRADIRSPFGDEHVVAELSSPACDGDPSLSADGTTLVFTSDRDGTAGLEDLWITERTCVAR